ncbi:hypothetical protein OAO55_02725 [Bacteroidales bacterium]|nr:hypothetical protein [Bacteroidales bacterium]
MELLEILKYILPAIIVLITAVLMMKNLYNEEDKKRRMNLVLKNREIITPLRLQAYERVIILLERISPESLVMRTQNTANYSHELQAALLNAIRSEFDHNVSQQLYLSPEAWGYVVNAKTKITNFINTTSRQVNPKGSAMELRTKLLEATVEMETLPTQKAIQYLKKEIAQIFSN